MNRRGFLASCLALGAAPAVVRAESLMRVHSSRWTVAESGLLIPGGLYEYVLEQLSQRLAKRMNDDILGGNGYACGEITGVMELTFDNILGYAGAETVSVLSVRHAMVRL